MEQRAVEGRAQRFGAEVGQQPVAGRVAPGPEQGAETAGVGEPEAAPVFQHQVQVVVRARRGVGRQDAQRPRHAQVQDGGARGGADEQVLGTTLDRTHRLAGQLALQGPGHRPAQPPLADDHGRDAAAGQVGRDAAAGGFDLGQFGHGRRLGNGGDTIQQNSAGATDLPRRPWPRVAASCYPCPSWQAIEKERAWNEKSMSPSSGRAVPG